MPEVFFPSQTLNPTELFGSGHPILAKLPHQNALNCNALNANMPYCLAQTYAHPESKTITQTLAAMPEKPKQNLMCTIDHVGNFTTTLAAFYDEHLAFFNLSSTTGIVGAGTTASETRLSGFQKALVDYQNTLVALNKEKGIGRGPSTARSHLKAKVRVAYDKLQLRYQAELNKLATPGSLGKNRGNALSSADRGIALAQRRGRRINVANTKQAIQLAQLSKGISYAGKGLVVLDAGIRANGVYSTYKTGGDWQREAAIQTTAYGAAGAAGLGAGQAVVYGLTAIGLGLTPVGWVVMIGIGITAGFGLAYLADEQAKTFAGRVWDRKNLF